MTSLDRLPRTALVALAIAGGLAFQLLLGTSYTAASLDPVGESTGVPIAIVNLDEGPHGRRFAEALGQSAAVVRWETHASRDDAVRALERKEAMGALVLPRNFSARLDSFASNDPRAAHVETLSNPGASTSGSIVAERALAAALDALRARIREEAIAGAEIATLGMGAITLDQARFVAEPVVVQRATVNPVSAKGAAGLAPTYLAMAAWLGGYFGAIALERFRAQTRLRPPARAAISAGAAVVQAAAAATMLLWIGLDVPDLRQLVLLLALGTWMAYALVSLMLDVMGLAGVVPAFAVLALGLPAAGAVYPVEMVPEAFRALHPYSPFTWLVESLRTTLHAPFAGDAAAHATSLVLLALACTALSVALGMLPTRAGRAGRA